MIRLYLAAVLVLLALAPAAPVVQAQQTRAGEVHRFEIRDGRVFHDGIEISTQGLPEGLDVRGITFMFEYSGPVMPALTLDGRVYTLDGDRLTIVEEPVDAAGARVVAVAPEILAEEGRRQAEEAYLATLSERDRVLYARLMREREMELDAIRLTYYFHHTADASERPQIRHRLHQLLSALFDLKQDNRREEIRQVEAMLEAMQLQVQEREQQRDEIIRQRLEQLTVDP